jgi:NAD(P)H-flavin reductase
VIEPTNPVATATAVEAPYRVASLERRTATIVELWLRPVAGALPFLPGQYVLLEDLDGPRLACCWRPDQGSRRCERCSRRRC